MSQVRLVESIWNGEVQLDAERENTGKHKKHAKSTQTEKV